MVFAFVETSFIMLARISFRHYTDYSDILLLKK